MSARVEEQHRNCCCRPMRAAVRMYRMPAEEAVAELRRIEDQEGAESGPSRVADGLEGSDGHSRTPATGDARKSAESDADGNMASPEPEGEKPSLVEDVMGEVFAAYEKMVLATSSGLADRLRGPSKGQERR